MWRDMCGSVRLTRTGPQGNCLGIFEVSDMWPVLIGGWTMEGPEAAEWVADFVLSLRRADLPNLSASIYMWGDDRHESELSHVIAGRRSFPLWRMLKLPPAFHIEFLKLRAARVGHQVVDDGIGEVLRDVRAHLRRGNEAA